MLAADARTIHLRPRQDAVPLFLLVAEPLLALLAATLRAIIDRRGRPLLKRAASDPDAQKQADEWAACAGRVLGGATVRPVALVLPLCFVVGC